MGRYVLGLLLHTFHFQRPCAELMNNTCRIYNYISRYVQLFEYANKYDNAVKKKIINSCTSTVPYVYNQTTSWFEIDIFLFFLVL